MGRGGDLCGAWWVVVGRVKGVRGVGRGLETWEPRLSVRLAWNAWKLIFPFVFKGFSISVRGRIIAKKTFLIFLHFWV